MVAKRIIVVPLLVWLALMGVTTFFRYDKIVREKDSIVFIPYRYGLPEVGRRVKRCPLECVNTIRMRTSSPLFFCLTYTLNGKDYLLRDFNPVRHYRSRSVRDYDPLIRKIKALASKSEGEGFYWSRSFTLREFTKNAFVFLFMAGISAIVASRY